MVTLAIQNPVAFFVAAVIRKLPPKRSRPFRTIFFVPAVLSLVIITKLWVNIFSPTYGLLNKVLAALGLKFLATAWLTDVHTALWAVIFIVIWQGFGWALLFYFSGLMTVPRDLEEAAMIDGASGLTLYGRIIIPYLLPVIQAVAVIGIISCLKQMEIVYLSTNGAPGDTTQFIANYVYIKAFTYSQYGYGNALRVLFVVIAVGLTLLTQRDHAGLPEETRERLRKDDPLLLPVDPRRAAALSPGVAAGLQPRDKRRALRPGAAALAPALPVGQLRPGVGGRRDPAVPLEPHHGGGRLGDCLHALLLHDRLRLHADALAAPRAVYGIVMLGMVVPLHTTLLPNFIWFNVFGLINRRWA